MNGHFSCQYEVEFFSRLHLYWSVSHLVSSIFRTAPISIDHYLVSLSLSSQDRTYITRLSSVLVCVFKVAPISIGHLSISSVRLSFSGPHLYRLIIHCLVSSIWVRVAPISIGHLSISLVRLRFLGPHLYRSVIHLSCPFEFEFLRSHLYRSVINSAWLFGTAPISIGHWSCQFS